MNQVTPQMRILARDLVAHEASGNRSSEAEAPAPFHVIDELRPHLANLMGKGGFRALLARAVVLASAEVSWLEGVHVSADGALQGLEAFHSQVEPAEFSEGRIVLLAQVLELLVALIGSVLTGRLVGEIWPTLHSTKSISAYNEVQRDTAK